MKRTFYWLCANDPSNVINSQVVEYLESLASLDLEFNLVFMLSSTALTQNRKSVLENINKIQKKNQGRVNWIPAPRSLSHIGSFFVAIQLNRLIDSHDRENKIIIHGRGVEGAYLAHILKRKRGDVSYVYDVRGDKIAEFIYLANQINLPRKQVERKTSFFLKREKEACKNADYVFCVSSVLKDRVVERCGVDHEKFMIVPCCADDKKFRYDEEKRIHMRKLLNLTDKYVLIYSGGLTKWHCPEQIFDIAGALMRQHKNIHMIILTPHVEYANQLAERFLPEDCCLVKKVDSSLVPSYLMASDAGLMIRENDPLNEVASPTKFAEYIMCGLPVLISDKIGDYSNLVKTQDLGIVLEASGHEQSFQRQFLKFYQNRDLVDRKRISKIGTLKYSKDVFAKHMRDVYLGI